VLLPALEASMNRSSWVTRLAAPVIAIALSGQAPGDGGRVSPSVTAAPAGPEPVGAETRGGQADPGRAEAAPAEQGFPLTVRVSQLRNDQGRVAVAVFASPSDFPDQKRALRGQLAKIEKGHAAVTFTGLKPGLYAVAVLHDENDNAKMDFNFLGMPLEGYGFSNDASAPFGPPSFEAAAFKLTPRASYIPVKVRYFL
jgi:uncharacterized protein (DUF2141 family)